eukprot:g145.t1
MRLQKWLYSHFTHISEVFGFEQVDFPVLESEELFTRKAGEEITEQLFNFRDKGGRKVSLRPELTPSLARLLIQKGKALILPTKWYSIGQCWRYERMTRGRRREHYQWNMDIIGVAGQEAEVELLAALVLLFERLGLTSNDVGIKISSRKILQEVTSKYNIPQDQFASVCVIVDKIGKLPESEIRTLLEKMGISTDGVEGILGALGGSSMEQLGVMLGQDSEAVKDLERLYTLAEGYGLLDWLVLDTAVVRGLAYYTGIVFEAFDRSGTLRAICGGGRYDRLLGTFGGENQLCVGFGFGDAVIIELLKEKELIPELNHKVDDFVIVVDESLRPVAGEVVQLLRRNGRRVDLGLESRRMKWAFKHVERIGAKRMIIIGQKEWSEGLVRVKDLSSREEQNLKIKDLLNVS